MRAKRMPVVYAPHGGGPWPFVDCGFGTRPELDALRGYLASLGAIAGGPPRAILAVSAHWEAPLPTLMTAAAPPMLYDYGGFPPEAYTLTWPAPGAPWLAPRAEELLRVAGFETARDDRRGYDHGTFVPLKVAFPEARVPVLQLSLVAGLRADVHLALGRALEPLREEGVLIVASGMSFHDMRAFFRRGGAPAAEAFDAWLRDAVARPQPERDALLEHWERAPHARSAHPREEHLIPLMVAAGAAGSDRGAIPYNGTFVGLRLAAVHFG
jgi:aromatic ring-opening dioxygenase catalytic subunit (LigB family)